MLLSGVARPARSEGRRGGARPDDAKVIGEHVTDGWVTIEPHADLAERSPTGPAAFPDPDDSPGEGRIPRDVRHVDTIALVEPGH